ncbi:MAG: hypothetical protein HZB15_04805 [Actinobacteria bacterium]|nr:hypothetical protein [Actinomycetota bacterium]
MRPRRVRPKLGIVAAAALAVGLVSSPASAADLPDPVPVPPLPPIAAPDADSTRLVPVPTGCAAPPQEQVVFVGTVVAADSATARFAVQSVRSGSTEGFEVGGLIDVRYGEEVKFLDVDDTYVVGAGVDPTLLVLASTVREPAPLFGGNEVAGVNDSDVECPRLTDPMRTLDADGTSVESGVLTPLLDAKGDIIRAILQPAGVAFAIPVGLLAMKLLLFAMGRSLRDLGSDRPDRRRRHDPRMLE